MRWQSVHNKKYVLGDLQAIAREVTRILRDFAKQFFPASQVIEPLDEMIEVQDTLGAMMSV